jgi:hydrogenase 3 maturation protease
MPPAKHSGSNWSREISRKLKGAERLFVLGVGNRRKGDDAAGSLCIRLLAREVTRRKRSPSAGGEESGRPRASPRKPPALEFQVLDAGETPENATGLIRDFRPTHVLIIDAALGGFQPGTINVIDKEKIGDEDISTHRIPLVHLVRYLEESVGCRVIPVGIEPATLAWDEPVSPAVRKAASELAVYLSQMATRPRP